jgi:acyl transferase domain-containing protein/acyl-CoA synthetase (AMP-forming)/AMP-acid ligase II
MSASRRAETRRRARSSRRSPNTLAEALANQAEQRPDKLAMRFIEPGGATLSLSEVSTLSFGELAARAASIAQQLVDCAVPGDRALLLCPPGLDYVAALFGCFYSSLVAVPAYPMVTEDADERLRALLEDSRPRVVLTTSLLASLCRAGLERVDVGSGVTLISVDEIESAGTGPVAHSKPSDLALLQYTSGSTGKPRGVMLSHANFIANTSSIEARLELDPDDDQGAFWLPPYHDMGLVGGILTPVIVGGPTTLMSPLSFIANPLLWLEVMSHYRATISAAPNFGFELCVRKADEERVAALDLRPWKSVVVGAEPIQLATMDRFIERFAEVGFRRSVLMPCYGLAEATLLVTASRLAPDAEATDGERRRDDEPEPQAASALRSAVPVGTTDQASTVLIVDPATRTVCPDGVEGEVWFQGPSVGSGYWNNEQETGAVFKGELADEPSSGAFLRTGDLGFVDDGELYVTGRLKDLIIVKGQNYYPHDIEDAVTNADRRLRPGCIAAFEVSEYDGQRVVVVAEARGALDHGEAEEVWRNARAAVAKELDLVLGELVLIERNTSAKTSSGKIRRRATREAYLNGTLAAIAAHRTIPTAEELPKAGSTLGARARGPVLAQPDESAERTEGDVEAERPGAGILMGIPGPDRDAATLDLVLDELAAMLGSASAKQIDPYARLKELGLDSQASVELGSRLADVTGLELPAMLVFDYPTPAGLARSLRLIAEGRLPTEDVDRHEPAKGAQGEPEGPLAIVGMSCRYPGGVASPEELWELIASGTDAISSFPGDRGWDLSGIYHPDAEHREACHAREGGFLHDVGDFDASFFGIGPREALAMDPQQRLLLEASWEAIEGAGIDPCSLEGSQTGVFAGISSSEYGSLVSGSSSEGLEGYRLTGLTGSVASGRIAYTLGLEGPAISLDTACSSSLVAVHLACQALRSGDCSLALAGGVTIMASPSALIEFSAQRVSAPDGRCKPFAACADGVGWSEGVGMLLLERLTDAQRNGHEVFALIRGSAVNQDGASNGLTAPNGLSQQRVIAQALSNARLSPSDVDVVEAHGTGTKLGDPIEAQALLARYGTGRDPGRPLWLGSVKSNIGHTQAAAGVAGVIKMVMAMRHGRLPRTLHVDRPSSHVDWSTGTMSLLTEEVPWERSQDGRPRRAGVSSFGISGTNAHVILEESDDPLPAGIAVSSSSSALVDTFAEGEPSPSRGESSSSGIGGVGGFGVEGWVLSARSEGALRGQAQRLRRFVLSNPHVSPGDVALSLTGRPMLEHRAVIVGEARERLLEGLSAIANGDPQSAGNVLSGVSVAGGLSAFLFTGQGAQYVGMGAGLYERFGVFRDVFDEACVLLDGLQGWDCSLRDVVFGGGELSAEGLLDRTVFTQAGLFALELALFRLLESWGVAPGFVAGHSIGELVAGCVAGVFSLEDACRLVAARGGLMESLPPGGAMVAVGASEGEVLDRGLPEGVALAAVNGPASVVVSGDEEPVLRFAGEWEGRGCKTKRLVVSHAFHSHRMDPMLEEFEAVAKSIDYAQPKIPIVSGLTGRRASADEICDARYWVRQARETVRFAHVVKWLAGQGVRAFLEVGPGRALSAMVAEAAARREEPDGEGDGDWLVAAPLLKDGREPQSLLEGLAQAWSVGAKLDWRVVPAHGESARRVALPSYAFQRERFWPVGGNRVGAVAAVDEGFWGAVETGDVGVLARELCLGEEEHSSLQVVLPSLGEWWRRRRERSLVADWCYGVDWERVGDGWGVPAGRWLVVVPAGLDEGWVDGIVGALVGVGVDAVRVDVEDGILCDRGSLGEVLGELVVDGCDGVLSLLGLREDRLDGLSAVPLGLAGTLTLAQAVGDVGLGEVPVWLASSAAVSVGRSDVLDSPVQGMVWGLGRVAGLEGSGRGGLVDLPVVVDERAQRWLCVALGGVGHEDQLAVRSDGLFARRLVRAEIGDELATGWTPAGASVLVTGGLGGLGTSVARWLGRKGARRLVLVSRRGGDAPGATGLCEELEALGADVSIVACDVSDRSALGELLESLARDAPLDAVVHAAGVQGGTPIDGMDAQRLQETLAPKALAGLHLHELTRDMGLSAFVVFSSLAATMGSGGQGDYAAANALLDALVVHRRSHGLPATSLAWGPWEGTGMVASPELEEQLVRRGLLSMPPEQAISVLDHALAEGRGCLTVASIDWDRYAPTFAVARPRPLIEDLPEARAALERHRGGADATLEGSPLEGRLVGLSKKERERVVLELVLAQAAGVLGHSDPGAVDAGRAFRELGVDSLAAVELRNRLVSRTGVRLDATVVFDHPTPRALARYLLDEVTGSRSGAASVVMRAKSEEPVAIVGMSCRFPGGIGSAEECWELLAGGGDAIGSLPADRGWDPVELDDPERYGTEWTREGGFVHDAASFDAGLFGIAPREALAMDPQQRLLLEASWEAFEHASVDPVSLRGTDTGVFAGLAPSIYGMGAASSNRALQGYVFTGSAPSVASGRVAYAFGLEGPAVSVDTACSSSLVALHLACQALRAGECSLALAGGVTVISTPFVFGEFARQGALALDGRCKAFSDDADGVGWSEGVGLVVLERLSDARRNGHRVLAVVRGSAVNQDGASNGLTAPNGPSQQRVILQALASAGLSPDDVDVVEAHGTGTRLGDPIEAQALLATYGKSRDPQRPLWLGSVKSNIGHTQAAAGVAGVIKIVMALQHERLPRTLHVDCPSSHVDWSAGAVSLLSEEVEWTRSADGRPRRAGVSSFGVSGTNAHVILEEGDSLPLAAPIAVSPAAPTTVSLGADSAHAVAGAAVVAGAGDGVVTGAAAAAVAGDGVGTDDAGASGVDLPAGAVGVLGVGVVPWMLSARSASALGGQAERLREFVLSNPDARVVDVAASLTGRPTLEHRAVVIGRDRGGLLAGLGALEAGDGGSLGSVLKGVARAGERVVFVFPGQGSQWPGMAVDLLSSSPVFAEWLGECERALAPFVDWSVEGVLRGEGDAPSLERVDVVQPVLFCVMVSLAGLWRACGVRPDAVVGHSQGEIAAAFVAGALSLSDAARVVTARSSALVALAGRGGMVSVAGGVEEVERLLESCGGSMSIAAVNGPRSVVVSGDVGAIESLLGECERSSLKARRIAVDYAAHSTQIEVLAEELRDACAALRPQRGEVSFYSAVSGGRLDGAELDGEYWYRNLRERVNLDGAVGALLEDGFATFLEVSPAPSLTVGILESAELRDDVIGGSPGGSVDMGRRVHALGSLRRGDGGSERFTRSLAEAWVAGADVSWAALVPECAQRVVLPSYAFQRERFWLAGRGVDDPVSLGQGVAGHPLLGAAVGLADGGWLFTGRLCLGEHGWLGDHAVLGSVLFPGTAFLELATFVCGRVGCGVVRELTLQAPLVLGEGGVQLQVRVGEVDESGARSMSVWSRAEGDGVDGEDEWTCHAVGSLAGVEDGGQSGLDGVGLGVDGVWPPVGAEPVPIEDLYDRLADMGLEYGPVFQGLMWAWCRGDEVFADVCLPDSEFERAGSFGVHPALLDSALHAIAAAGSFGGGRSGLVSSDGLVMPFSWSDVRLFAGGAPVLRVWLRRAGDGGVSVVVGDGDGGLVAAGSLVFRRVSVEEAGALGSSSTAKRPSESSGIVPSEALGRDLTDPRIDTRSSSLGGDGEPGRSVRASSRGAASDRGGVGLLARLLAEAPEDRRPSVVVELVRSHVAGVLGHDAPGAVDEGRTFKELGFDSLTAVELRNRLEAATGMRLPATLAFDHPTPQSLAQRLLELAMHDPKAANGSMHDELSKLERLLRELDHRQRSRMSTRLRGSGLLDVLLRLASSEDDRTEDAQTPESAVGLIESMEIEDLVQRAMHGSAVE